MINLALAQPCIALVFGLGAVVFSAIALNARALVISVLAFVAAGALVAVSLIAFNDANAALAEALIGVGLLPALILAGLLLSARTVKPRRVRRPWFAAVFALAIIVILLWVLLGADPARTRALDQDAPFSVLGFAPLLLALATGCLALLGFGERGALDHPPMVEREP